VKYDIYVSEDGNAYTAWLTGTSLTTTTFTGQSGHSYRFYSIAIDAAGNVEDAPAVPDAATTIGTLFSVQSIAAVSPDPRSTTVSYVNVLFTTSIDPASLSSSDFILTRNGGANLLTGKEVITGSGASFRINGLSGLTRGDGVYVLTLDAAGARDLAGNPGSGTKSESWTMDGGPYLIGITPIDPSLRETSVDSIEFTFSEPIVAASLSSANLKLTWNNGPNLLTGGETISLVAGSTWRIGGLSGLTNADGKYTFSVNSAGVSDLSGHIGAGSGAASWTLKRVPPKVASITPVSPNPTNVPLDALTVTFSEPVDPATLDAGDLILRRNGIVVPLSGSEKFVFVSGNTWQIAGLADSTGVDGSYNLTLDTAAIRDLAGNAGASTRAIAWKQDFTPPAVRSFGTITPNPRNSPLDTVSFSLSEAVQGTTLDVGDLTLFRDGQVVPWNGAQSVEFVSGNTWRIVGLAGLTGVDGDYRLSVDSSGIVDLAGNIGNTTGEIGWKQDNIAPTSSIVPFGSATATSFAIPLVITGSDPAASNGAAPAGLKYYDIYVATGSGPFTLWRTVAAASTTKVTYVGESDHVYRFRSVARDKAGNIESKAADWTDATLAVPDLSPPATAVTLVDTSKSTFVVTMQGKDAGSNGVIDSFTLYVSIDGGSIRKVATVAGGTPGTDGNYTVHVPFRALADGVSHSYRFFSVGRDGTGKTEPVPVAPADVEVSAAFAPLQVTDVDVEKGADQRSIVRALDLIFSRPDDIAAMIATISDGIGGNEALRLRRFTLNGTAPSSIGLGGTMSHQGNRLSFDFGSVGLADGYYELGFDLDGNGSLDQFLHFYRLKGDLTGDGSVDSHDSSLLASLLGQTGLGQPFDMDLSGVVDNADVNQLKKLLGRQLGAGLPLDD
jgi:hypothetical protein